MAKDLTTSHIDRQNILNNDLAINEIQNKTNCRGVFFESKIVFTKELISSFYEVDVRTIERYIASFSDELKRNGYEVIRGKKLREFVVGRTWPIWYRH